MSLPEDSQKSSTQPQQGWWQRLRGRFQEAVVEDDKKIDPVQRPLEAEVASLYGQKFWDAGSQVVTLMFGLAFAIYLAEGQSPEFRTLTQTYYAVLMRLSVAGNVGALVVLWRCYWHELRLISVISDHGLLKDAIRSGWHLKAGLMLFNSLTYFIVITLIWIWNPTAQ